MVVNIGFAGNVRKPGPIPTRTKPYAVNLSGEAMRQHEKAMEYQGRLAKANAELMAAMASLADANAEIDRLGAKVALLESELKEAQEKLSVTTREDRDDPGQGIASGAPEPPASAEKAARQARRRKSDRASA